MLPTGPDRREAHGRRGEGGQGGHRRGDRLDLGPRPDQPRDAASGSASIFRPPRSSSRSSGHPEGKPFPWLVSDFGLVDAIESGITKIPRLPVSDTTGRPDPKYFRLWDHIAEQGEADRPSRGQGGQAEAGSRLSRRPRRLCNTLASQWAERFQLIQAASDAADKTPPVLIVVCDNVDIAEVFYRNISGETMEEVVDRRRDRPTTRRRMRRAKTSRRPPSPRQRNRSAG